MGLAVALAMSLLMAAPSSADPARPGDYRSEVTGLVPRASGVHLRVVGGDGFLDLRVDLGHEVLVRGYSDEPWLRIRRDGTVEQNVRSEATYLDADRYARVQVPPIADNSAPPRWDVIGHGGAHVWHDHRIHWMAPARPPGKQAGDLVFADWTVPMVVDGRSIEAHGRLTWVHPVHPLRWVLVGLGVTGALVAVARRRPRPVLGVALAVIGAAATIVGIGQRWATPVEAGGTPMVFAVPALGLAAALIGLALRHRPSALTALIVSTAMSAGWAVLRFPVLLHPVLPTVLSPSVDRGVTVLALATTATAAGFIAVPGALRPPGDGRDG